MNISKRIPSKLSGCVLVSRDNETIFEGGDPGVSFISSRQPDGTVITAISNFGHNVWQLRRDILKD